MHADVPGTVMRTQKIGRDAALALDKAKRPRVQPNKGFWMWLGIWEECKYEVWEEMEGVRREKRAYGVWKAEAEAEVKAEERMRRRGLALQ